MQILLSRRIRKREFGGKITDDDMVVLRRTAIVTLAASVAGPGLPTGTRLLKAYGTSKTGPKRVIYLLVVGDGDLFLLFFRGKNDPIGSNASPANPKFREELQKYLSLLHEDVLAGEIEAINLDEKKSGKRG